MGPLRRQQLVYLSADGWSRLLAREARGDRGAALHLWAERRLPLVFTQQSCGGRGADDMALGLAAPRELPPRRIALRVDRRDIASTSEFPPARDTARLLPRGSRAGLLQLFDGLSALGAAPRAYGSYGWEVLTGLRYVHEASDLDLWLAVGSLAQADAAVTQLAARGAGGVRLDGELMFRNGTAVAWREYAAWRAGRVRSLLVKRLDGVALESAPEALLA